MILVTGGAGYIGSHVVRQLADQGHTVLVYDNLSTGHRAAVDRRALFIQGDLRNEHHLDKLFRSHSIEGVMHFAASALVGESVVQPLHYYENNVSASLTLFKVMLRHDVRKLVFSSSCATYGAPNADIIAETCDQRPVNPYGRSKLMVEQMLADLSSSAGLRYIALRYFNAAGAHPSGDIGECHDPESHLIPSILRHLLGKTPGVAVFGGDYDTPDGSCIRDYIHVIDLADAHIAALHQLLSHHSASNVYNVGTGRGCSVNEIIRLCESITGRQAVIAHAPRRPGDPPRLVASCDKINLELGWEPRHDPTSIIRSAWNWHRKHPDGYPT